MRAVFGIMAMLAVLPGVAARAQEAPSPPVAAAAPEAIAPLAGDLDAIFSKWMTENHIPGLVYGVVSGGQLAYVKGLGVQDLPGQRAVTPASLFRIASMTKAFTALSILKLRDEGRLALDDPADRYVPELRGWTYPTSDAPRITIRDLLTHSAGFVTDDPWGDRQQVLSQSAFTALLKAGVPFTRAPEMRHEYANLGYAILGRVIANITKAPYRSYVEQRLLTPLGMSASGFDVLAHPKVLRAVGYRWENGAWAEEPTMKDGAFNAMGGLEVSATDYAKWLGFILSAWPPRDGAEAGPVKRGTVRQIMRGANNAAVFHRPATGGEGQCPGAIAYGMGWRVITDCEYGTVLSHGGGFPGYGSHVMVLPEFGVALFALTNRTYAGPSQPVWDAAALLLAKHAIAKRPEPVSAELAAFYAAAQAVWTAGTVDPLAGRTSMNFPMDRTAANWANVLAATKTQAGACDTAAPVAAGGAMSGTFAWTCEKGRITGEVLLAPTRPITLQSLKFSFEPKP
jgi:CubicO group peptidase (beta-lactamase class C family)